MEQSVWIHMVFVFNVPNESALIDKDLFYLGPCLVEHCLSRSYLLT